MSPTVLRIGPYRLFFFSNEGTELPHIHVERDDSLAKFWLSPVEIASSSGFGAGELRRIQRIVETEATRLEDAWHEYFDSDS